nr:oligopeptide/dipeptide ABC transporter ATP-binding protein [Chromatium okenii]
MPTRCGDVFGAHRRTGRSRRLLTDPRHPYTRALLSAVPVIDPAQRRTIIRLDGEMPSPRQPPSGCHFHPRCPTPCPTALAPILKFSDSALGDRCGVFAPTSHLDHYTTGNSRFVDTSSQSSRR